MAFQFALQTLLRLREAIEERERLALEICLRQWNELRAGLEQLQAGAQRRRMQQQERLYRAGLSGAELHFGVECQCSESLALQQLERALVDADKACQAQRERYASAHRSRELLESLRDQQRTAFMSAQARREQNAADDLFLLRMSRNRLP